MNTQDWMSTEVAGTKVYGRTVDELKQRVATAMRGGRITGPQPSWASGGNSAARSLSAPAAAGRSRAARVPSTPARCEPVKIRARALTYLPFELNGQQFCFSRKMSFNEGRIPLLDDLGRRIGEAQLWHNTFGDGVELIGYVNEPEAIGSIRRGTLGLKTKIEPCRVSPSGAGLMAESVFIRAVVLTAGTEDAGSTRPEIVA